MPPKRSIGEITPLFAPLYIGLDTGGGEDAPDLDDRGTINKVSVIFRLDKMECYSDPDLILSPYVTTSRKCNSNEEGRCAGLDFRKTTPHNARPCD
jgi:hypothetical protein